MKNAALKRRIPALLLLVILCFTYMVSGSSLAEDGETINCYATTTHKVNFRKEASKASRILEVLKKDTHVYVIYFLESKNGDQWSCVMVNGQIGYIMTEYLDILPAEESEEWDKAQASPAPLFRLKNGYPEEMPSPEPTAVPTVVPTEAPTEIPTATPTAAPEIPVGELINRYGKINVSKVNFRPAASTMSGRIRQLTEDTWVYMIYTLETETGERWTRVMVDGELGYIMTQYLSLLTEEDSLAWDEIQETPAPVFTMEEAFPTASPETATPEPSVQDREAEVAPPAQIPEASVPQGGTQCSECSEPAEMILYVTDSWGNSQSYSMCRKHYEEYKDMYNAMNGWTAR